MALEIYIDFPQESESIDSNVYTFRLGATSGTTRVEISVDGGPWLACRPASGYWWHDWVSFARGEHFMRARAFGHDGSAIESRIRRFRRI